MSDVLTPHDGPALADALARLQASHPRAIDLGLERIDRVCAALGRPERALPPVIHVAGTNGKGSCTAFLRAIAEAAGLRTHVLTSPHLVRFVERLRLAGAFAAEEAWVEALREVDFANAGGPLSFFEAVTAAQFLLMSRTPADLSVIEVGLGGRYDATNLVTPAVSVITPIGLDHREFLGDTLAAIAAEKAGIVKPGVPVVCAAQPAEVLAVIAREAARARAPLTVLGGDGVELDPAEASLENGRLQVAWRGRHFDLPPPALRGEHQATNAGLAVVAALTLDDARIDAPALARGVAQARWPARLQRLAVGPLARLAAARGADLWLDGAHNPHAAHAVAAFARDLAARDGRPVMAVVGLLANKDAAGVFAALRPFMSRLIATGFTAPAAAAPEALAAVGLGVGANVAAACDVTQAVHALLETEGPPPHVIICGSLYLAGEVLALDRATWPT